MINNLHGVPTESLKNIKNYFCKFDCVNNLNYDVSFSILPRYLCNAGCKFCYIKNYWESPIENLSTLNIDETYQNRLFKFLSQFRFVNCIDNLRMLKNKYPNLYSFYLKNSSRMSYGCLTDNAILQNFDILMNEMNFRTIHEISLTDEFVQNNPDVAELIVRLNYKVSIRLVKFIYTFNDKEKSDNVFRTIENNCFKTIDIIRHKNIMDDKYHNGLYDLSDMELHFKPLYAENGKIFHVLGDGAIHVYYDKLKFSTDDGASSKLLGEFGTIDDLGIDLIFKMIKGKVVKYNDYIKNIKNVDNNLFYNYYKFICENLVINEEGNFIPEFVLTKRSVFFNILSEQGWVDTQFGLLKEQGNKVLSVITWKKQNNE